MRVLIATAGASSRPALAATRALARKGAQVTVCGGRTEGMAFRSRFVSERFEVPDPKNDPDGYLSALVDAARSRRFDVLLTTSEYTVGPIVDHRKELSPHVAVAVPEPEAFHCARDKFSVIEPARRAGLGAPRSEAPASHDALRALSERIDYPCILKPRCGHGAGFVSVVDSAEDLLARVAAWPSDADPVYDLRPLVQELVPGEIHDVNVLMNHGEPCAAMTQRRLRMQPARGGPGILSETTWEPQLRDAAIALLSALRWHGPAQVELKRDPRDGIVKIIEVNPRFWGTLDLAIQAGVDFPGLTSRLALEEAVKPVFEYRVGLRYRWPFPHGLRYVRQHPKPLSAAWAFLGPARDTHWDLWATDPIPHVAEGWILARDRRRRRRRARSAV